MDPRKPLYLKTYGTQMRKLSAWISPDNRKQAFESQSSSDGDVSVFEPTKPTTIRGRKANVASRRAMRPAKKNAMLCLKEKSYNEENICEEIFIPSPQPAKQSTKTRQRKNSVCNSKAGRPAKRKTQCLSENCSDEDIGLPSLPRRQPAQQSKTTRKSRLVSVPGALKRRKRQHDPITSESEEDSRSSAKCHKMKRTSVGHRPSASRFVTCRRRAVPTKSKPPKATVSVLNSSDDFTSGAFGSSRILRPSKRRIHLLSSLENSVNTERTGSFSTNPFREISLNELTDHSLGPSSRKPIFCSTPSASSFSKQPRGKPFPISGQSSPPSMSVSCVDLLSSFQDDLDSPGQPRTASPAVLHSGAKQQSNIGEKQPGPRYHGEPSGKLFLRLKNKSKTSSCSTVAKHHGEDRKTKNSGALPSLSLLTTDSESSSHFVSASGGLEWLIEAVKEKCLTPNCTVQLERLDNLTVTQLCSKTTYSSCLGHSSSVHKQPTNEHSLSVDNGHTMDPLSSSQPSIYLHLSRTNNATGDHLQSVNSFASSVISPSVDFKWSAKRSSATESMERSTSGLKVESTHCIDSSVDCVMGTQSPTDSPVPTFSGEEAVAVRKKSLAEESTVRLKALASSQRTVQQLKGFRGAGWVCDDKSLNPDANRSENDHTCNTEGPEGLARSREIDEKMMVSVRQFTTSAVAQPQTHDPETLVMMLKEECLTDKLVVAMKKIEILQHKDTTLKSPTDISDSAIDEQANSNHQSESDTNDCEGETSSINVNMKKRCSTSSENNISSYNEGVKNCCDVLPKRKKASAAPREKKRKSTSTDRPGTTRKACVSGLSVNRWKTKNSSGTHVFKSRTARRGATRAVDCSISELISTQPKQPLELVGATMNFSTPVRAGRLNLSSLLADLTPNTHTWSRLKAALSVHRKGLVLRTPKSSHPVSGSPGRAELTDVSQDLFGTPFRRPRSKRLQSQLLSCESLEVCEDADLSDAEKVYAECGQQGPLPWEECILPQRMKQCVKIGEGTFGEVFSTTNASGDTVALKIIPLEGSEKVNGEDQKTFGEILHEIIISKELSSLKEKQRNQTHGFIGLNDLHCVRGCYPPDFLKAWDTFDQQKESENDRPNFFEQDQLFLILEFEFGGSDLENSNGMLASLGVAKSILHQVTAALAVAEEELNFEHRDLHWGNVLVKTTKQKTGSFLLNGTTHSVETKGVLVRIIDYSLSRLEIDDLTVSCDISNDEELFMGHGDYQFDIYRLMREENGNNWSNYHPHTNVLWLHYLCSKLLSMKYRGAGGRAAKAVRGELTRFYDNVLQYSSATEALHNCPMFQ